VHVLLVAHAVETTCVITINFIDLYVQYKIERKRKIAIDRKEDCDNLEKRKGLHRIEKRKDCDQKERRIDRDRI